MTPVETVLAFLDAINSDDADKVAEWITEDHVFIDTLGNSLQGREKMRAGFRGYYAMCPDYRISREDIFHNGDIVALFGRAGGTIRVNGELLPENTWQIPDAWRAVVRDGLIREWRVYADNKPVNDILAKSPSKQPGACKNPVSKSLQRHLGTGRQHSQSGEFRLHRVRPLDGRAHSTSFHLRFAAHLFGSHRPEQQSIAWELHAFCGGRDRIRAAA